MTSTRTILFNFPSRTRPKRCEQALDNIFSNISEAPFKILLKLDSDDPVARKYPVIDCDAITVVTGRSQSKIHAVNRDIPDGWDILVNMSDDIRFTKKDFDVIIRNHCGADDFVVFPEPYADREINKSANGPISVVSIIGIDYYKRDGYVYHPSYLRTHCDNEATQVAMSRGCLKRVEVPIFYHEHPAAGYKNVNDSLYKLERKTWKFDERNYNKRKSINFGL